MKVLKFGGTSVKNATAMKNVAGILSEYEDNVLVILSACGGITNKITSSIQLAAVDKSYEDITDEIRLHHINLCNELILNDELNAIVRQRVESLINSLKEIHEGVNLLKECTPKSSDHASSFGELLSTTIFYYYLLSLGIDTAFADSRKIMITDSSYIEANVNFEQFYKNTTDLLLPLVKKHKVTVAQGFIANDLNGTTTTLGRGGSDYSATLFGAALKYAGADIEEIHIWTDVSGVLSGDPRKLLNTKTVPLMTFSEIRDLSFYGAKVLHPNTIKPANEAQIPVRVLNTYVPLNPGTLIVDVSDDKNYMLHSAVLKENCILLRKKVSAKENSHQLLSDYLKELQDNSIKVMFSNSTESSLSIIVEESNSIMPGEKFTNENVSIICLSGANITTDTKGQILLDIASVLSDNMPLQIVYGASDVSILLTYKTINAKKALKSIHELIITGYL